MTLFYRLNQPQPLCLSLDFQGYLICQIPKDALEVELRIKTKWGKFTLHIDQFTRHGEVQGMEEDQSLQDPLKKKKKQHR